MQRRREAGFSFIEILVVMGIISVLVSMVVVVIPFIQEKARRTKSLDNIGSIMKFYIGNDAGVSQPWPGLNGKKLTLWPVAKQWIDKRNPKNLEILFSPGDTNYTFETAGAKAYDDVTVDALRGEGHDFRKLTSYAGRRNADPGHKLTPSELSKGALVFCDDDDGALHHRDGLVTGWSNGAARFMTWEDFGMTRPENENDPSGILGENSPNEELKHMTSGS